MGNYTSSAKGNSNSAKSDKVNSITEQQAQAKIDEFINKLEKDAEVFLNPRNTTNFEDLFPEYETYQIEHHTVKDLKSTYIDDLNDDIKAGRGLAYYDTDQVINILYKDGKVVRVDTDWDETKRIPTSNIDSIIVESGWGAAVAGKNVLLYDNNAAVKVGNGAYQFKSAIDKYNAIQRDVSDIRFDFKSNLKREK